MQLEAGRRDAQGRLTQRHACARCARRAPLAALPPRARRGTRGLGIAPGQRSSLGACNEPRKTLRNAMPDYAKDLRLNLESVLSEAGAPGLDAKQIRAVALASAIASRHRAAGRRRIEAFAAEQLSPEEIDGARAAAAIMAMNNIYYRFTHLIHERRVRHAARRPAHERHGATRASTRSSFELRVARGVGDQRLRRVHGLARDARCASTTSARRACRARCRSPRWCTRSR